MTAIVVRNFRGEVPRTSDRSLGASQAVIARNCRLTSGRLDPLKGLQLSYSTLLPALRTVYRYRFENTEEWFAWESRVHVAASPVANDAFGRIYFTGAGEPRMTTLAAAVDGSGIYPAAWFVLGPAAPSSAPTVTPSGGVGADEERSYVYTFRTALGEESGPSPASALTTGKPDGTWTIGGMQDAPPNSGTILAVARNVPDVGFCRVTLDSGFGLAEGEVVRFSAVGGMAALEGSFTLAGVIGSAVDVVLNTTQVFTSGGTWERQAPHNTAGMTKRIYRTIAAEFRFVAEVSVGTASYADTILSSIVGQQDPLPALTLPPPKNLRSLVVLANGAMAGISGNQVCFSEQNKPHSWPISNRYAFAGEGVALTAVGNSAILLTDSYPVVFTATVPEAASASRLNVYAPCYSEPGTVDSGDGALYPSYDGLYLATPGGARNITEGLYRREEWEALLPRTFVSAYFDQSYYAGHTSLVAPLRQCLVLDLTMPDGVIEVDERADLFYANPIDGKLYLGQDGTLYQWDADTANPYTAVWRSRTYQMGADVNFGFYRVHAAFPRVNTADVAQLAANQALLGTPDGPAAAVNEIEVNALDVNGSLIVPVSVAAPTRCQFTLLADGDDAYTTEVTSSREDRLPSGFATNVYAFEISTTVPVFSVAVANDTAELESDNA
jgi:hypothetical protein